MTIMVLYNQLKLCFHWDWQHEFVPPTCGTLNCTSCCVSTGSTGLPTMPSLKINMSWNGWPNNLKLKVHKITLSIRLHLPLISAKLNLSSSMSIFSHSSTNCVDSASIPLISSCSCFSCFIFLAFSSCFLCSSLCCSASFLLASNNLNNMSRFPSSVVKHKSDYLFFFIFIFQQA